MTRTISRRFPRGAVLLAVSTILACSNDSAGSDVPYVVTPVSSTTLAGTPGRTLAETLVVEVRTADGHLVPGATVHWSLPQGGSLAVQLADANAPMTGTTDDKGRNSAVWTLGLPEGTQQAKVAAGLGEPATFTVTATALHALSVSVGGDFACAVLTDQRPVCWGANGYGQLGTGDTLSRATPAAVAGLMAAEEVQASPDGFACARDMAGDVWCWGHNPAGQAGPAAAQPVQLLPVRVAGAEGAASLALGGWFGNFSCAVLQAGGAKCWGANTSGQLGTGDQVSSATPRSVLGSGSFTQIGAAFDRACAVTSSWDVWCWGDARGGDFAPYPRGLYLTPIQPIPGYRLSAVELTYFAGCGMGMSGEAICWGDPIDLGLGMMPSSYPIPAPVHPNTDATFAQIVSDGAGLAMGRTRDGHVVFWGTLGGDWVRLPTPLDASLRIADVAAGNGVYCVIAESGALYCDSSRYWFDQGKNQLQALPPL